MAAYQAGSLPSILYDSVTLRHFAAAQQLQLLQAVHANHPPPRWVETVHDEIQSTSRVATGPDRTHCRYILSRASRAWLDDPSTPTAADSPGIMVLLVALNGGRQPPLAHAGEAESVYFASQLGGILATDDNAAFDFAQHRLGVGRVIDTVDILKSAVRAGLVADADARNIVVRIRTSGRYLRDPPRPDPQRVFPLISTGRCLLLSTLLGHGRPHQRVVGIGDGQILVDGVDYGEAVMRRSGQPRSGASPYGASSRTRVEDWA